jgi:hypothetical protein
MQQRIHATLAEHLEIGHLLCETIEAELGAGVRA